MRRILKAEEIDMIEPVKLADFFTVFFSAASVILFGASYALIFAWSRVRHRPRLMPLAYAAYVGLFVSVIVLAFAANLFNNTFWTVIVMLMLIGYLLAPHAIWHLCVGTHADELEDGGAGAPGTAPAKFFQQR
jgi:glucan phosphoethanolaminetransferase (alkaline phosphatase superfamily)